MNGAMEILDEAQEQDVMGQYLFETGGEELSEIQKTTYKRSQEVLEFASALISQASGHKPSDRNNVVRSSSPGVIISSHVHTAASSPQQVILNSPNGAHNGEYMVVDPNLKLVVTPSGTTLARTPSIAARPTVRLAPATGVTTTGSYRMRSASTVGKPVRNASHIQIPATFPGSRPKQASPLTPTTTSKWVNMGATSSVRKPSVKEVNNGPVVDLTAEETNRALVKDPEEQPAIVPGAGVLSKMDGAPEKTYPSLVVVARTSMCNRSYSQAVMTTERLLLDNRLKRLLQMPPGMFIEHLLQERLIKCDQFCSNHPQNKLILGMYSDSNKFPFSGGYVWIANCCPSELTSVFKGSIFEIGPHPPITILKLIYHWSCQTSVANVLQWVKSVDKSFLKTFYMYLRAACIAAIHGKYPILGGPGCKRIEVGVISLGTSTSTGGTREVKVDILGAMDYDSGLVRLRALDHLNIPDPSARASEVYMKKFQRILESLQRWVNPKAVIVTDFTIDRNLCRQYGFVNMVQSSDPKCNNGHIMNYLRLHVPRMFQNTLNLLSRSLIQQFLDELVWRETWGQIPSRAYDTIIEHIADQTKLDGPEDMSVRYTLIASNPNRDWRYENWSCNMSQANIPRKTSGTTVLKTVPKISSFAKDVLAGVRRLSKPQVTAPSSHTNLANVTHPEPVGQVPELAQIALEPYYYGTILGDPSKQKPTGLFGAFLTECLLCKKDLFSSSAFTNHLVHHALNSLKDMETLPVSSLQSVCRFCMKPTPNLENHVKEFHKQSHLTKRTMCKICNTIHRDDAALISHMIYTHCELDLPYFCELCHYRTSIYQDMLIHFDSRHNKDTCVQCPYCLKVVRFAARSGEDVPRNQIYFIQHIQKHTIARQIRKCEKCCLSFTNLSTLRNHQEYFHNSCASVENVERYDLNPNDFILMAAPLVDPPPPLSLTDADNFTIQGVPLAPGIRIDPDLKFFLCAECDGPISQQHFCVRMTCTKCRFQTCCANAIKEHNAAAHQVFSYRPHLIGGRATLKKPLYCSVCGYSTSNGNAMATHLSKHDNDDNAFALSDKRKASSLVTESATDQTTHRKNVCSDSSDCSTGAEPSDSTPVK